MFYGPDEYKVRNSGVSTEMRKDIVDRAKIFRGYFKNDIDKRTCFKGNERIRTDIANFIMKRDGVTGVTAEDVLCSNGASSSIGFTLKTLVNDDKDAVSL